jgi:tellurite resistance protein TehA-like permease
LLEALLWLGLTYVFFAAVAAHEHKPRLTRGLSGSWLLAVVATQSVSLLGTLVGSQFKDDEPMVLFVSLSIFLSACLLYLALIPLILNRLELLSLAPSAFTPDYWINMGAMAITTLTGGMLISAAERWSVLQQVYPFLLGLTMLFWAGATWWIPLLILLELWRHVLRRVRLTYATEYWSLVFPVGMYAACTFEVADLVQLELLALFAHWLAYVALSLWLIVFAGLLRHLLSTIIGAARSRATTGNQTAHRVI